MKNIQFKKRKTHKALSSGLIAVICVIITALLVAVGFIVAKKVLADRQTAAPSGYSFSQSGFEKVALVQALNEEMAVFTDSESGKKGLMTLSGKITEKAEHDDFWVCSDVWRSFRYIAKSPLSEYDLLVDAQTKTVTTRQYHGLTYPERTPCWSEVGRHLAWTDKSGYGGEIKVADLPLAPGLYPVSASLAENAKYGYINASLRLEIPLLFEKALDFSNGLAAAKKDGKWGYIDSSGITVIPFEFESVASADCMDMDTAFAFKNNLAPVKKDGKFGIINTKGETVVDFSFDSILQGENGVYIASKGGKWGLITVESKFVAIETTASAVDPSSQGEPAFASGKYLVKTAGSVLNMRAAASADSNVIIKIPNGSQVTVTKSVPGWAYATYNSSKGWVSTDFLIKIDESATAVG